jgi:UDP-N-acetyl-D-galactosamine dehydrogenase
VIENTQRDLNIALINELALIFNKLNIPTKEVLAAAGTKWNFLNFTPGLVGGHCIGVDPYYLTHKAEQIGYLPQVILAGRRINDGMGKYVAEHTVKQMIQAGKVVKGARVLILGLTFKENVPDIRNTKVVDIVRELADYGADVLIHDPLANAAETRQEYGLELTALKDVGAVDAVIYAVNHQQFSGLTPAEIKTLCGNGNGQGVLIDVKSVFSRAEVEEKGLRYWSL